MARPAPPHPNGPRQTHHPIHPIPIQTTCAQPDLSPTHSQTIEGNTRYDGISLLLPRTRSPPHAPPASVPRVHDNGLSHLPPPPPLAHNAQAALVRFRRILTCPQWLGSVGWHSSQRR